MSDAGTRMLLAQLFPGMEWIPVLMLGTICVGIVIALALAVGIVAILPLGKLEGQRARAMRVYAVPVLAVIILVVLARSSGFSFMRPADAEKITVGMTAAEVENILGSPSERHRRGDGTETWHYYFDWTGLGWFGVWFDAEGRVTKKWLE